LSKKNRTWVKNEYMALAFLDHQMVYRRCRDRERGLAGAPGGAEEGGKVDETDSDCHMLGTSLALAARVFLSQNDLGEAPHASQYSLKIGPSSTLEH
jgi:hypothetical protein